MRYCFAFTCFFCLVSQVISQSYWCERKLENAQILYKEGKVDVIPGLVLPCFDEQGFNPDQKKRTYRLLVNSYLAMAQRDSAEWAYFELLRQDPMFFPNIQSGDLPELMILSGNYRNTPVWEFALYAGMEYGKGHLIASKQRAPIQKTDQDYTSRVIPFRQALRVQRHLGKLFSVSLDVANAHTEYSLEYRFDTEPFQFGDFTCVSGDYSQYEKTRWISLPVGLQYYPLGSDPIYRFKKRGIVPYLHAALSMNVVFESNLLDIRINYVAEDPRDPCPTEVQSSLSLDNSGIRKSLVLGGEIGFGIKYKVDKNFFFVELKYIPLFSNMARNPENTPVLLQETFHYIDNAFNYRAFSGNIGYSIALYKPKKLGESKFKKLFEPSK